MAQYKTGTATFTNGSATVTGTGTAWLSSLKAGDDFVRKGDTLTTYPAYEVGSIVSDTELTLTAPYGGDSAIDVEYVAHIDFQADGKTPKFDNGDIETASIFNKFGLLYSSIKAWVYELFVSSVDSISQLPPATGSGRKVSVTGYHDGNFALMNPYKGGGEFVDVGLARHDGVINFDPNRAFPTDWNDAGQRAAWYADSGVDAPCWVRTDSSHLTAEMAGAKTDGVTGCSDAVQSIVNRLQPIHFGPHEYVIDKQITFPDGTVGNTGLIGEGRGTTLLTITANPAPNAKGEKVVFTKNGNADVGIVEGIRFSGDGTQTCFGNDVNKDWARTKFYNCDFLNLKRGLSMRECVLPLVEGCDFLCSEFGVYFENTYNQSVTFINCFFRNATDVGGWGLYYDSTSASFNNNLTLIGCSTDDCDSGTFVRNARLTLINCGWETHQNVHLHVDNCEVTICGAHFLPLASPAATGILAENNSQITEVVSARFVNAGDFSNVIDVQSGTIYTTLGNKRASGVAISGGAEYGSARSFQVDFVPQIIGATTPGTATYSMQRGKYQVSDKLVTFSIRLDFTGHTGTGGARIILPLPVGTDTEVTHSVWLDGFSYTGEPFSVSFAGSSNTRLYQNTAGASPSVIDVPVSGVVIVSGTYFID